MINIVQFIHSCVSRLLSLTRCIINTLCRSFIHCFHTFSLLSRNSDHHRPSSSSTSTVASLQAIISCNFNPFLLIPVAMPCCQKERGEKNPCQPFKTEPEQLFLLHQQKKLQQLQQPPCQQCCCHQTATPTVASVVVVAKSVLTVRSSLPPPPPTLPLTMIASATIHVGIITVVSTHLQHTKVQQQKKARILMIIIIVITVK